MPSAPAFTCQPAWWPAVEGSPSATAVMLAPVSVVGVDRGIRPAAADDRVGAGAADERVVAGAAVEQVIAAEAGERVVAGIPGELVVARRPGKGQPSRAGGVRLQGDIDDVVVERIPRMREGRVESAAELVEFDEPVVEAGDRVAGDGPAVRIRQRRCRCCHYSGRPAGRPDRSRCCW